MRSGMQARRWVVRLFAGAGLTVLAAAAAPAQTPATPTTYNPPAPCQPPAWQTPGVAPPAAQQPGQAPTPQAPTQDTSAPTTPSPFSFAPEGSALALSGGSASVAATAAGYVDFAVPVSQFRLRFDAAYGNNRPDRAEFFYGKCGCFRVLTGPENEPFRDPNAPGPILRETNVDYQEVRPYLEWAFSNRFSTFVEAPIRFINPDLNANEAGFSNLLFGAKYALVADPCQYLTFQFVTATPTADVDRGLGNQLWALEPGILYYRQISDRIGWHNEVRDWIPLGGTDFAGNILRYGTAVSYLMYNGPRVRVYSISELVGWSVLSGKELTERGVVDAGGDTIVNAKGGIRFGFGPIVGPANLSRSDLYIGVGRALTGEVWYKDLVRVEYSWRF